MANSPEPHGFTRVDEQARPADWVARLDMLHRHPFYRDYKQRVRAILAPRPAGLYLEVGAGAGTDAIALGSRVIGIDRSLTMCREARARGLTLSLMADAERLPLPSALVDGCWADRTFQHLLDPLRALAELVRVTKPDGRIVVVDPDYGTQAMTFPDRGLARKVMGFRAHRMLRNGTMAHQMGRCFSEAGLSDISVEEKRLIVRDPGSLENVFGLRSWPRTACAQGEIGDADVDRWETLYDAIVAGGTFSWSVSFFITSGVKKE